MTSEKVSPRTFPNRLFYTVLVVIAVIAAFRNDYSTALITGGISLVFDPFDPGLAFPKRPRWQQAWLCLHLAGVFILMGRMLLKV